MKRDTTADRERTARIEDTADTITQSAQGVVPESAVIPELNKFLQIYQQLLQQWHAPTTTVQTRLHKGCTRDSYYR